MSELEVIQATQQMVTLKELKTKLNQLGVQKGSHVLVHSSLSSFGWVAGGAQTVISSLLEAVGEEGTVFMPAQSGDWSDPATWQNPPVPKEWVEEIYQTWPAFDPNLTPTRLMGKIAELFRTIPGSYRSYHPDSSFSGKGKFAKEFLQEHPLVPKLGWESPLGKMYQTDIQILLLGVGYENCTAFHLAETRIPEMPRKTYGSAIFENNKRVWKWYDDIIYDADDFDQLGEAFEKENEVSKVVIGKATCRLFNIQPAVDFAEKWIRQNRTF